MRNLTVTIERNEPFRAPPAEPTWARPDGAGDRQYRPDIHPTRQGRNDIERLPTGTLSAVDSRALVLGGASSVWRDIAVLETLIDGYWPGLVIAVNDIGCIWPRRIDHWVTIHPEKLRQHTGTLRCPHDKKHGWLECRRESGLPDGYKLWSHTKNARHGPVLDHVVNQWGSGSSGLLAVTAAYTLGCRKVVLAGMPMDDRPHFSESVVHHPDMRWTSVRSHRKAWENNLGRIRERTRSLSGWTRKVLGFPDLGWLEGSERRQAA